MKLSPFTTLICYGISLFAPIIGFGIDILASSNATSGTVQEPAWYAINLITFKVDGGEAGFTDYCEKFQSAYGYLGIGPHTPIYGSEKGQSSLNFVQTSYLSDQAELMFVIKYPSNQALKDSVFNADYIRNLYPLRQGSLEKGVVALSKRLDAREPSTQDGGARTYHVVRSLLSPTMKSTALAQYKAYLKKFEPMAAKYGGRIESSVYVPEVTVEGKFKADVLYFMRFPDESSRENCMKDVAVRALRSSYGKIFDESIYNIIRRTDWDDQL